MIKILDTFSDQILDIYVNNFPDYLRSPKSKFRKCIHKYKFYDLWLDNNNNKFNVNNVIKNATSNCLNKQDAYLNTNFSNLHTQTLFDVSLIGFSFLNFFPAYSLIHLDFFALDKKYQGNGNGSKYLKYVIDTFYIKNNKIKYFILECEDHLVKFYEKNGFVKVNYNYYYNGIKLNLMIYNDIDKSDFLKLFVIAKFLSYCFNLELSTTEFVDDTNNILDYYKHLILIMEKLKYHIFDNFKKK